MVEPLIIPSNPNMVAHVERFLKVVASQYKVASKFPSILISLTEAVNNAIIHGNDCDEKKMVKINVQTIKKGIVFIVSDEGKGFNKDEVCDPTCQENLEKVGGRGVLIMDTLCDELTFRNNGSIVKMYFKF